MSLKYYFCEITEFNGSEEYLNSFLIVKEPEVDLDTKWDEIILTIRGEGTGERDPVTDLIWYSENLAALDERNLREVTPEEYMILSNYLRTR